MGVRFRRSYKIAPGVKINLNKKSVGISVGGKYLRKSINTSGRKTTTVGTPIKGLYFTDSTTSSAKKPKVKVKAVPKQSTKKNSSSEKSIHNTQTTNEPKKWIAPLLKSEKAGIAAIGILLLLIGFALALVVGDGISEGTLDSLVGETTTEEAAVFATDVFEKDDGTQWIVIDGFVSEDYNGVLRSDEGKWYYVKDGMVQTAYSGVQANAYGAWYVSNGEVDFHANGLYSSEGDQFFVKDGKVETSVNGILKTPKGWLFFEEGKVDTAFEGVSQNEYGTWYVKSGRVMFEYTGPLKADEKDYWVAGGRASLLRSRTAASRTATTVAQRTTAYYESPDYDGPQDVSGDYVGNFNTRVFHRVSCRFVAEIEEQETGQPRDWYISQGYRPCKVCNP